MDASSFLTIGFLAVGIGTVCVLRWGVALPKLSWKVTKPKPSFSLELVGRLHLSSQHSIQVVRVGDRVLVVGIAGSSMTVLDSLASEQASGIECAVKSQRRAA